MGDNVSTDEIMPAGERVLPYRSNIPAISRFVFADVDDGYAARVSAADTPTGHIVVGGDNYGQGSSTEHAVIAPRYLGLRAVIAKSFARIHWQNLANFGILALEFTAPDDYDDIDRGDTLVLEGLHDGLSTRTISVDNNTKGHTYQVTHRLSERQAAMVAAGGRIPWQKENQPDLAQLHEEAS